MPVSWGSRFHQGSFKIHYTGKYDYWLRPIEARLGQTLEILIYWFCWEASHSFLWDFPAWGHMASCEAYLCQLQGTALFVNTAVSHCTLWSGQSAAPQRIFSPVSRLTHFPAGWTASPVRLSDVTQVTEWVSCSAMMLSVGPFRFPGLLSDQQTTWSLFCNRISLFQRNGIKLLASGFWLLQKHQQE